MKTNITDKPPKIPVSVLVVLHDGNGNILLIERADCKNFWQSVTGSLEPNETPQAAAIREVLEETGIYLSDGQLKNWHESTEYEIYPHWRHRYPPGITHNTEHIFSAEINRQTPIKISLCEHTAYAWLPQAEAAVKVFSPSNRAAILNLHKHLF
ncbi:MULTISPECIES: dihydroneopterin triphosphate diphosphatase [Neisseria]|uniref:NUDIX domain protein n=1 Tax=Neisseria musculi TaxID=1815583 RepID=A0A7H1M9Y7_9NEIS|nr:MULTISPECIES: dihydroneopterin triphosphate diphosphatase [Neisseria]MBF0803703.1 dihydroneopterin triphosphate diphosphatase [Neisseria sp. 19428wB4_WF04]QNT58452.1 NUDIX domain protein [Neisseria musculi]TFU43610.1 dihydroneopterin triphosphate diphosphatase [Neisseria sp. WF04]